MKTKRILCLRCGIVFDMSKKEALWYRKNGFHSPSCCQLCRSIRRTEERQQWRRKMKFTEKEENRSIERIY